MQMVQAPSGQALTSDSCNEAVAAHIRAAIARSSEVVAFRELLTDLMMRPGRVLAPHGAPKWPAFVLATCAALGGDPVTGVDAAAAVEFAVAAIDVTDDLVDDEWPEGTGERARALNASLALGWLAQGCAGRLAEHLGVDRAHRIGMLIGEGGLASCAGQDCDLVLEGVADAGEELAHEATRLKSGSLVAMACRVGAAVAIDDPEVIALLGRFGTHVGVVAQLLNDLVDVDPDAERGSDLRRRKKTLPIVYALRCARDGDAGPLLHRYRQGVTLSEQDEQCLVVAMRDLGALHYTWVVAEAHRREALAVLPELARLVGGDQVYQLRRLVPPVRLRRTSG